MFTGLVETIGVITGVRASGRSVELRVRADAGDFSVADGGSVAVDGVCLTVEGRGGGGEMLFTAVAETLGRTTLGRASAGRRVNLERALRVDGRLDGHIVLGHVDAVGRIVSDEGEGAGAGVVRTVEVPEGLAPFIAEKGSVAVDGVSLTVAGVGRGTFSVSLIPATMGRTTMSVKRAGDPVNIECDVLARYIYRMARAGAAFAGSAGVAVDSGEPAGESLIGKMERLGF